MFKLRAYLLSFVRPRSARARAALVLALIAAALEACAWLALAHPAADPVAWLRALGMSARPAPSLFADEIALRSITAAVLAALAAWLGWLAVRRAAALAAAGEADARIAWAKALMAAVPRELDRRWPGPMPVAPPAGEASALSAAGGFACASILAAALCSTTLAGVAWWLLPPTAWLLTASVGFALLLFCVSADSPWRGLDQASSDDELEARFAVKAPVLPSMVAMGRGEALLERFERDACRAAHARLAAFDHATNLHALKGLGFTAGCAACLGLSTAQGLLAPTAAVTIALALRLAWLALGLRGAATAAARGASAHEATTALTRDLAAHAQPHVRAQTPPVDPFEEAHAPSGMAVRVQDLLMAERGRVCLKLRSLTINRGGLVTLAGTRSEVRPFAEALLGLRLPAGGRAVVHGAGVGFVPRDPVVSSGDAGHEVGLGALDLDDDALTHALQLAEAGDRPCATPQGRVRVALARAIAHDPDLLLIDDVFAHLTSEEADGLVATLERLGQDRTVLALSASPAVLQHARRVVDFKRGSFAPHFAEGELRLAS